MNRLLVRRAAAGLAAWVGARRRVVVGFDARHKSADFAADTAGVLTAAGCDALPFDRHVPKPALAFALRHLGCDAGVMVTASHNPAGDDGYKVYAGDGAQIVPPIDAEISAAIDAVTDATPAGGGWSTVGDEVVDAYVERASRVVPADGPRHLRIVHTPLHGVGGDVVAAVLRRAGFADVQVVAAQAAPDPDFPTVAFPNPEEPGAMDLAFADAARLGADLVLANDPDADRLAVGSA